MKANLKKDPPRKQYVKKKEKGKEIKLHIDIGVVIGKMTIPILLKEIAKLPKQQQQLKNSPGIQEEELLEKLQNIHIPDQNLGHEPFLLTLAINDLFLHNCMLDLGASTNIMPLTVMKQLGLSITWPYKRVCGFNSKHVEVEGIIKDLKASLARNPHIFFFVDVIVIDIHDVWRILLSRKWGATIRGHVQMDLSYATISQSDGTPFILYREPAYLPHVIKLGPYYGTCEIEKPSHILPT